MAETLVTAERVSKKFCKSMRSAMLYGLQDVAGAIVGRQPTTDLREDEFWAIDNVSFQLERGQCLGLIGPNGSGKSTLLKMLNGIIAPDKGRITIRGKVGALIEVGSGFHPLLTGRENIYVNGAILGFSKKEIDRKFDEIVDFAGIGDFIDTPVKHYSSGMYVRLGFAVAAQMEPDVLLIDEVLAVGDIGFKTKCYNAINKITQKAAVIFVSHSMPHIARLCTHLCVLQGGKAIYQGDDVQAGIDRYHDCFEMTTGQVTVSGKATIDDVTFESTAGVGVDKIHYADDLTIHLTMTVAPAYRHPIVGLSFLDRELKGVAQCVSSFNKFRVKNQGDPIHLAIHIPKLPLNPDIYYVSFFVYDDNYSELLAHHFATRQLRIIGDFVGITPVQFKGEWQQKTPTHTTGTF